MMKKLLLGAALGFAFVAAGCEEQNTNRPVGADRGTARTDTVTSTTETTTTREDVNLRWKVTNIDKEKNEVTLAPIEGEVSGTTDVQRTAGREKTMSFDDFKTKASFVGDINSLKEGQEVTLKDEASGTTPDMKKIDTNKTDTTTPEKPY